jgi:L-2-hydroxyglutarate oxidase LhgO
VVAVEEGEVEELERICEQGRRSGVEDLKLLSQAELRDLEPNVRGIAGLLSPSTGVVDCHHLMRFLYQQAVDRGVKFVFSSEVVGIDREGDRYRVEVREADGVSHVNTHILINSAGLGSDKVAQSAGVDIDKSGYRLHYCKGEYFAASPKVGRLVERLIYPVPEHAGVGIHLTSDFEDNTRLGPDVEYVDEIGYAVDETKREMFYRFVVRYLPAIKMDDLTPDFVGVRPKLQAPGEGFRDFVISHEEGSGFHGLINLVGIESPGLTASLAIAKHVAAMVKDVLA